MLFDAVNDVRSQASWSEVWDRMLTPNREQFAEQHRRIVDAITSRNPAGAADCMRSHLNLVHEAMSSRSSYATSVPSRGSSKAAKLINN
jgi:DNA-binding FadR family transcriptional regulator